MLRRLLACLVAALAAAPSALAGGPTPPVVQGQAGVLAPGGGVRYVTVRSRHATTVEAIRTRDGHVLRFRSYRGSWGVPRAAFDGSGGAVSRDGRTLVLASTQGGNPLKTRSSFTVLRTSNLLARAEVALRGDFSFDALSPDGSRLYLIQHVSEANLTRYVVRAYDLDRNRLLPDRIADKTQRGWVMEGMPVTRATSANGRWAYTLYMRPGGTPFVHALDTVRGVAHCIGIPWTGKQDRLWQMRMSLRDGDRTLSLHWRSGREHVAIANGTWRISYPASAHGGGSGFPWWTLGAGAAGALLAAAALAAGRRRRLAPARAATS
jgi:hypothetical protein